MRKIKITNLLIAFFVVMLGSYAFATDSGIEPGSLTKVPDFTNVTKGLYYDGTDFYYLLDTGIPAANYMYNMDGDRFYFGDDGKMVKNELVQYENEYYFFDENGAMLKNRWATQQIVDPFDNSVEDRISYYFGPTGRAYRAAEGQGVVVKTIDGERYGFNGDAERLSGYVNESGDELDEDDVYAYADCVYYFDPTENDSAATGWHLYTGLKDTALYEDDKEMYLYFDEKTCRKVYSKDSDKYLHRTIEGQRYMFNNDGVRYFKWYGSVASASSPKYYSDDYDGFLAKGWFSAVPASTSQRDKNKKRHTDEEDCWFYADSKGRLLRSCIKKIGNYTYAFDEDGVMQADAFVVVKNGIYQRTYDAEDISRKQLLYGASEGGYLNDGEKWMYFTSPENENLIGSMCALNKSVKAELKDEDIVFCANSKGGYSMTTVTAVFERNGKLFQNGVLLTPLNDYKYGVVRRDLTTIDHSDETGAEATTLYYEVVDKVGNVKTKYGALKDGNGNYVLCRANGEFVGVSSVEAQYVVSKNAWKYKADGVWHDGFPPEEYMVDVSSYLINCDTYTNGYADIYAAKYRK